MISHKYYNGSVNFEHSEYLYEHNCREVETMSTMKRTLTLMLMLAMLISSMPVMADEMVELTPEQIAEPTGAGGTYECR